MLVVVKNGTKMDKIRKALTSLSFEKDDRKHKIKLFHIGEQKNNLVSLGYDDENDIFLHPSIDFGGLTNIGQTPGDNIYKLTSGTFASVKGSLTISGGDTDYFTFTQFGQYVVASNGVNPPMYYLMGTSSNFATLQSLVTSSG